MAAIKLRDYQHKTVELLRESFRTGHRTPLVRLPTGSGKTAIAGEIINMALAKGKKVAFIVDRIALVDQASAHLFSIGVDHGIIQGNNPLTDYAKPVQVVSIQTMNRRRPWEFDLAIIDEAHIVFKAHKKIINDWNNIPFIGLSATPFSKGLGLVYDDLINSISMPELIEQGYLVDAEAFGPSKPDMTGVKTTGNDYNKKEAGERANDPKLVASIVSTWQKLSNKRQTICFATNVLHSKYIVEQFKLVNVKAAHIDAYTHSDDRRETIEQFKRGEIKILSSVGVLTTGFDAPNAEVAILARPTKSLMLHIQMIGRVLRPFEGKDKALILDHAGNIERLGFHTDPLPETLDMGEKTEQDKREKLPKPCPECNYLKTTPKCPECGFVAEFTKENEIFEEAGELRSLKKANRESTPAEKIAFYGGLKTYAYNKGYAQGWSSHKYREKFGVWPNAYSDAPMVEPNDDVMGFIKYMNIKRAKSNQRRTP